MAKNSNLHSAKQAKNDEFYTRYEDIENEINAYITYNPNVFKDKVILLPCDDPEWSNFTKYFAMNFTRFGIKKLISTSYAKSQSNNQITQFESESENYDANKHDTHGKLFILESNGNRVDIDDLKFTYLEGDGDFRSEEVTNLRNEADIVITNPPFSLFREFLDWIMEGKKQFVILGNINVVTYKEVFPLLKNNEIWAGFIFNKTMEFIMSDSYELKGKAYIDSDGKKHGFVPGICWFTNLDHCGRHEPLQLDTKANNLKYNKKLKKKLDTYDVSDYPKYDNYDAIEVPFVECIPSDYEGIMGVPITFLDKYCPEQFEILGLGIANLGLSIGVQPYKIEHKKYRKEIQKRGTVDGDLYIIDKNNHPIVPYARILIKHKKGGNL